MRLLGVLLGWLALAAAWPALADEKFDPKQVRVITPTSATSKCIGDPKTPVCAVETFLACRARNKQELCDLVGQSKVSVEDEPYTISYRILIARIYTERNIPNDDTKRTISMKSGNAWVGVKDYHLTEDWCPEGCAVGFALRPTPNGWKILEWVMEGVD